MLAVLGGLLGLHAPDQVLERADRRRPRLALVAVAQIAALERALQVPAQELGEELGYRVAFDAALDLGLRDRGGEVLAVALVDFLDVRGEVLLGRPLLGRQESLQLDTQLVEDREVVGESVDDPVDDPVDRAVQRIVLPHLGRPAEARRRERIDEQARRMGLLGEERPVQHRDLQHGDLQPREQRLDAVGEIARLEDEVEQHRDHLDGHRLELVDALPERRILQVAQDVVHALGDAGEGDLGALDVESGLSGLQPRQALVKAGRGHDRRARHVARRRRRQGCEGLGAGGWCRMPGQREAAARGELAEHRHDVRLDGGRLRVRLLRSTGRLRGRGARTGPAHRTCGNDAQVGEMPVDVGIDLARSLRAEPGSASSGSGT